MSLAKEMAKTLRLCRKIHRLDLSEVAEKTGISESTICRMETGQCKNPSFKHVYILAHFYRIDLNEFNSTLPKKED